jgi:hypothetical protein
MQSESSCRPSAAEFPHDNPLFDRCALWDRSALEFTVSEPAPIAAPVPVASPVDVPVNVPVPVPETITETATATPTAAETAIETPTAPSSPPPAPDPDPDPVAAFVAAVTAVALVHGPAETAGHIESLFTFGTLDSEALSETAQAALFEGKILESTDEGVRPTESFAMTRMAWQSILRGESGDLSACGESTLDTWTADLVARLIAHPDKAQTIRRDLRRRGIAAFGMLS